MAHALLGKRRGVKSLSLTFLSVGTTRGTLLNLFTLQEGVGSVLSLTPCEEAKLEDYLKNYKENYFWPFHACQTPIQEGLKNLRYDLGMNFFPVSLGYALMDSGLVSKYNFYQATRPREGSNAPWAR